MTRSLTRIWIGLGFAFLTLVVAVVGYNMAGWDLIDAVYMVIITVYGVGYGEVRPVDTPGMKVFTMLVIIVGTAAAVYVLGGVFQMIAEGEINRALGERRMTRDIEKLTGHVIICGFGRIGQILAHELAEAGKPLVILDNSPDRVGSAADLKFLAMQGNATEEEALLAAGIQRAEVLATVLPDDAANVFITLSARNLNRHLSIMARGEQPSTERKLKQAGADQVILPASIGAQRLANLITRPSAIEFLNDAASRSILDGELEQLGLRIDELHVHPQSDLVDKPVGEVELNDNGVMLVVAIQRAQGQTISQPGKSITLQQGDKLIFMSHTGDIPKVLALQQPAPAPTSA